MAIFCGCDFIEPRIEAIQSGTNGPCSSECVQIGDSCGSVGPLVGQKGILEGQYETKVGR